MAGYDALDDATEHSESLDDALEKRRDSTYHLEQGKLPEDSGTPASISRATSEAMPADHPSTDTDLDVSDVYENGLTGRANP